MVYYSNPIRLINCRSLFRFSFVSAQSRPTFLCYTDMWFRAGKMEAAGCNTVKHWQTTRNNYSYGTGSVWKSHHVSNCEIWRLQFRHLFVATVLGTVTICR